MTAFLLQDVDQATALDDHTLEVVVREPRNYFPYILASTESLITVENKNSPPGLSLSAISRTMLKGSYRCSSTMLAMTTSKLLLGNRANSSSTGPQATWNPAARACAAAVARASEAKNEENR